MNLRKAAFQQGNGRVAARNAELSEECFKFNTKFQSETTKMDQITEQVGNISVFHYVLMQNTMDISPIIAAHLIRHSRRMTKNISPFNFKLTETHKIKIF
jgi:hypothetical protein